MGATLRLVLLCSFVIALMSFYASTDAGWAKGRIYIDMVGCYTGIPRKNETVTTAAITKYQKKCLKLNSDPQSLCYKLCILWWAKLLGKEAKDGDKILYKITSADAWTQAGVQLMGITKEDLKRSDNANKGHVANNIAKCNKDFSFLVDKGTDSDCKSLSPQLKTNWGQLIDCVEDAFETCQA